MLICDEYITPASLAEAFAAMETHRGHYRVVAGCTDTLPWAREGRAGDVEIPVLIDVTKIPELNEREVGDHRVRLGAATPIQRFLDDAALGCAMPASAAYPSPEAQLRRRERRAQQMHRPRRLRQTAQRAARAHPRGAS